jgi:hypothetical protein
MCDSTRNKFPPNFDLVKYSVTSTVYSHVMPWTQSERCKLNAVQSST